MLTVALEPDRSGLVLGRADGGKDVRGALQALGLTTVQPRRRGGRQVLDLVDGETLVGAGDQVHWHPQALLAVQKRAGIRAAAPAVLAAMRAFRDGDLADARLAVADSQLADVLDDHQVRNVAAMTVPDGWGTCVFDEQGTGKTVTLIAAFDLLVERNLADVMLVVSPKSMVAEWAVEFGRFTDGLYRVAVADGTARQKVEAIRQGGDVLVMGYETLVSQTEEVLRLARRSRLVLAVDESFNAKNPDAQRTLALQAVREYSERAFALCGTPAPNSAVDLFSQVGLVDLGLTFDGLQLPADPDIATAMVRSRLNDGFYLRNLKEQVLPDLPGRASVEVPVELAGDQLRAYEAACRDLVLDLRALSDQEYAAKIATFLARRSMLLRICSDPTPVVPGYRETPAKVAALDQLLPGLLGGGDKVLLWSFYRSSLDLLAARYAAHGLVRVDGSVSSADRRQAVQRFQQDPDVRVFVGNPAAAGAGLTLTAGRIAIYESMSSQAAHYMQSLDRIHRRGQQRNVEYYHLLCRDTIEVAEHARLLRKAEGQGRLLGDQAPERPTRTALLEELTGRQP